MGRSHSSKYSFQFDIERWTHPSCPELLTKDQLQEKNLNEDSAEVKVIILFVEGYVSFTEGNTSGLPENCYPDEYDSEIESIVDESGEDYFNKVSASEMKEIWQTLDNHFSNDDCHDDQYYDRDYSDYDDSYYHPYDDTDYNY